MKITHTAVFEGELQLSLTDDWLPWSSGKLVEIKIEGDRLLCSSYSTSCVSLQCGKCVQIKKKKSLRTNTGGPFRLQPELPELHITRQTFANTVRLLVELQIVYMSKDTVYKSNRERERERERERVLPLSCSSPWNTRVAEIDQVWIQIVFSLPTRFSETYFRTLLKRYTSKSVTN